MKSTRRSPTDSDQGPIALALVYDRAWSNDEGYDLFGDRNRVRQFGIWFSYDVWSPYRRIILGGEVGWAGWPEKSRYEEQDLNALLLTSTLHAGVNLRFVFMPWLQPYLRVAGGVTLMGVEFQSDRDPIYDVKRDFLKWDASPFGSFGGGLLVGTPPRFFETESGGFSTLSMGVMVEGGYTLAVPASFALKPKSDEDRRIKLKSAKLGDFNSSGAYLRPSLFIRF